MKKKFSNDDVDAQMFDLIRRDVVFELGKYLNNYTSIVYDIRVAIHKNDSKWSSMMAKRKTLYDNDFELLLEGLREAAESFE